MRFAAFTTSAKASQNPEWYLAIPKLQNFCLTLVFSAFLIHLWGIISGFIPLLTTPQHTYICIVIPVGNRIYDAGPSIGQSGSISIAVEKAKYPTTSYLSIGKLLGNKLSGTVKAITLIEGKHWQNLLRLKIDVCRILFLGDILGKFIHIYIYI